MTTAIDVKAYNWKRNWADNILKLSVNSIKAEIMVLVLINDQYTLLRSTIGDNDDDDDDYG